MSQKPTQQTETVPARRDPKKIEVFKQSRAGEIAGRKPGHVCEWFSTDPMHPQYIGKYLVEHERGDDDCGYVRIAPWKVVNSKEGTTQLAPRDDQGKPVDTTIRRGDLILAELPEEEHQKYEFIRARQSARDAKRLRAGKVGEAADFQSGGGVSLRGVVRQGSKDLGYAEAIASSDKED